MSDVSKSASSFTLPVTTDDLETAIDQALDGGMRAGELEDMAGRLQDRKRQLLLSGDDTGDLDRKIAALLQEAAVARFVEQSVRAAARRPRFEDDEEF
jgi:hypothetical protein